jgi:hypothetical protein
MGANAPAPLPITVHPTVRTRKKVPINSAIYLFMAFTPFHAVNSRI